MIIRRYKQSIQYKLVVWFLLILLPIITVSLLSNYISGAILKRQVSERVEKSLKSAVEYLQLIILKVDDTTARISMNVDMNEMLDGMTSELNASSLMEMRTIKQQMASILALDQSIVDIAVINGQSGVSLSWDKGVKYFIRVEQDEWYQLAAEANGGMILYVPSEDDAGKDSYWKRDRLYFIRLMDPYRINNMRRDFVVLAMERSTILNLIEPLIPSDRTQALLSYKGKLAWQRGLDTSSESTIGGDSNRAVSDGTKLLSFTAGHSGTGWELTIRQPEEEIMESSNTIRNFTLLITMISIILAVLASLLGYKVIAKPLSQLSNQMKQFGMGNFRASVSHNRQDELGYLMNGFNQMVAEQKKLIEQGYENELRLVKSEFQLLQSNINPHFLYNTLDCIYSVSEEHGTDEISEMVMNLAMFFRVNLRKGREVFTVSETIEHLNYYIRVQQIRLMDRFKVEINLEKRTEDLPLLKLLLQPLVENAIVHGLENSPGQGGMLYIHVSLMQENRLHIVIEDTGVGIPRDQLHLIQDELNAIQTGQLRSAMGEDVIVSSPFFALRNVKSRILLYYGPDSTMDIFSEEGRGTRVVLELPLSEDNGGW